MVTLVIVKDLIEITSYCFANEIILKNLKEFITIILCKKIFFFFGSYKLIIFKNMLVKVLKKYIINIMLEATKEYKLLFWN